MDVKDRNNLFEIRKQVGIVFQNPDNQTVASIVEDDVAFGPENIGLDREEIGERITFALDAVGMQTHRHGTPTRLSGGQKQRIAIAGVLALKPRVMILDESTAMLDPRGRKEVMEVVRKLNREENITVILITHFPEEALLADRAVVMHQGKIVLEGTPQSVFQKEDVLESYGLVTPRPIRLCRALTKKGLILSDDMDPRSLAEKLALALSSANIVNTTICGGQVCVHRTNGAQIPTWEEWFAPIFHTYTTRNRHLKLKPLKRWIWRFNRGNFLVLLGIREVENPPSCNT